MTVSLCIVARNEASFIADAIASAREAVDEVVVVDTGSTDGTVAIARAAGAQVASEPWPGDLGAAHDLPVAHARGDWVLILDADEVLDPACRDDVRRLAARGEHDGYAVSVRNYTYRIGDSKWRATDPLERHARGASGYLPTDPIRLFRRRPGYRFRGSLHQSIAPSILAGGGRIGRSDVLVHHHGFLRFDRDKSDLYLLLARREVTARPDDPQPWIDLGIALREDARPSEAAEAFRRAHALGDAAAAPFLLGSTLLDMGHPDAAVPLLRSAARANADDASPHFDAADAWELLGLALGSADRPPQAGRALRRAARAGKPTALGNLAAFLLDAGETDEAREVLERALVHHRGADTLWSLAGVADLRRGDLDGARRAFQNALDIRPENVAARFNLALTHRRAGEGQLAARFYAAAAEAIGSEEADRLDLARRLPRRFLAPSALRLPDAEPGLIVSVIPALAGGGGRVLVDAVQALAGRPQVVACADTFDASGQALRAELDAAGAPVVPVPSLPAFRALLRRLRPSVVLHHWWRGSFVPGALRGTGARWACIGHAPLPMPAGYDAYVVNSRFHGRFQAHLPEQRVHVIPNAVDLDRFVPAGPGGDRPVRIVMVSRLDPGKFPRRLLAHLPDLTGAELVVAGFGARRHELAPEVAARGLQDTVRFVGPVASGDVPALLATADIGLHLTETHEELCSMTVLEMQAAGLPVVAQPRGGLPEMVTNGTNGFLAADEAATARHLRSLIDSPVLRERMGRASREVARRYDMAVYRRSLRRLVNELESDGGDTARRPDPAGAAPRVDTGFVPERCYLVCASPRSGSSLLCEALTNTGLAGRPEEFFLPSLSRTLAGRWSTPDLRAYVDALVQRTASPNGVFGAKIMWAHLPALVERLRGELGRPDADAHQVLAEHLPGLCYVHIRRRDRVRQATSWRWAETTGTWTSEEELAVPTGNRPVPGFDRADLQRRIGHLRWIDKRWTRFLGRAGIQPVRVVYEELVADYEGTARRVLDELGVDVPTDLRFGRRRLRQQTSPAEEWARRFRQGAPG